MLPASGEMMLSRDGAQNAIRFAGQCIEAQFSLADGAVLLVLSDDSPYEEGLYVHLLDALGTVIDSILGSSPYASGIFKFKASGNNWMDFNFFSNDVTYRVSVLEASRFRFILPTGWKYQHRLNKHRLTVDALDAPVKEPS